MLFPGVHKDTPNPHLFHKTKCKYLLLTESLFVINTKIYILQISQTLTLHKLMVEWRVLIALWGTNSRIIQEQIYKLKIFWKNNNNEKLNK